MKYFIILLFIITLLAYVLYAKQNIEEEEICKKFLTSSTSSPISTQATKRNLKYDEDCEFSCELVLQDRDLPIQIRFVIHQGLGYLALKHIEIGLERQLTALRHFQILMKFDKNNFIFAFTVGFLAMDPVVGNPKLAADTFHSILYGKDYEISLSEVKVSSPKEIHQCRYLYIKALGHIGDKENALKELQAFIKDYPLDFDAYALYQMQGNLSSSLQDIELYHTNAPMEELYEEVVTQSTNDYQGFIPHIPTTTFALSSKINASIMRSSTTSTTTTIISEPEVVDQWEPKRYSTMLSEESFLGHINRREPFIIHFEDIKSMEQSLHWNTAIWRNPEKGNAYLLDKIGNEEVVLAEARLLDGNENTSYFGMGLDVYRRKTYFKNIIHDKFQYYDAISQLNYSLYMNIQNKVNEVGMKNITSKYRPPLHLLQADIPVPSMLQHIWENISGDNSLSNTSYSSIYNKINLWMGKSKSDTQSKLHMDATDNLYIVLEGSKQFTIIPPSQASKLHTVAPTYAVSPDGMSFQFNINKFRDYLISYKNNDNNNNRNNHKIANQSSNLIELDGMVVSSKTISSSSNNDNERNLFESYLLPQDITYEVANSHFSLLSSNQLHDDKYQIEDQSSTFELHAGDILYLPTGWFHQVKSRKGKHMAINYWWRALNWRDAINFEYQKSVQLYEKIINKYYNKS